jgi:hypothetical protein
MGYGAVFIQRSEILKVEQGAAFRIAKGGVCDRRSRPFLREVNFALDVLVLPCSPKDKVACRDRHLHGPMCGKLCLVMQDLAFFLQDLQVNREPTPLSQWASGLGESIRFPRKQLKVPFVYDGGPIACILDYVSLWFVLQRGESRVAIRSCFVVLILRGLIPRA